jgi:deoxycytidylate deaminase
VHNIPSGQQYEKCKSLHAEQNALLQCAKYGIPVAGASIYITDQPCELCAKQIFASGIIEVIILAESGRYCTKALHDFQEAGYVVRYLKEPT